MTNKAMSKTEALAAVLQSAVWYSKTDAYEALSPQTRSEFKTARKEVVALIQEVKKAESTHYGKLDMALQFLKHECGWFSIMEISVENLMDDALEYFGQEITESQAWAICIQVASAGTPSSAAESINDLVYEIAREMGCVKEDEDE